MFFRTLLRTKKINLFFLILTDQTIANSPHLSYTNGNGLIRAIKDSSIKLNCTQLILKNNFSNRNLKDQPQATLTKWWLNNELIDNTDSPGSDLLTIERSTLANEGNYTCEQFGDARASIYLKLQGKSF